MNPDQMRRWHNGETGLHPANAGGRKDHSPHPAPYDPTPAPAPSLADGTRVRLVEALGDYDGANHLPKGCEGVVVSYATPEIKRRQAWRAETYRVRFDFDRPDSPGRSIDRGRLQRLSG